MSRSGYSDGCDSWDLIRWRGAVASAIRGKRGQAFLSEMVEALDALPAPRLISDKLVNECGDCCAIGSVALRREIETAEIDPYDRCYVARVFGISEALAAEIAYKNDEHFTIETPEQRFARVRAWVVSKLAAEEKP